MVERRADSTEELEELRARVRTLEAELAARDQFIIASAHELRNPISPLMLHSQRMMAHARSSTDGTVSATWLEEQLAQFSRRLTRFMSALNRILDVSRIHSGQIELVREPVEVSELVRDVAAGFERELAASRSALELELEPGLVAQLDRLRMEQVVSNLISNAIRYGDSGRIIVAARRRLEAGGVPCVELMVADQGIGIAEADQARIFERFERAAHNHAGFGVGLWIVRELCEAMEGRVAVESRPGEGATFLVILPTNPSGSSDD